MVPIAVVGIAALMPGARDTAEFWDNIVTGKDLITDVPQGRWASEDFYDPDPATPDTTYSRRGAFLPEIEFDPLAHGLPPATLEAIDPAQLLGLTVADALLGDLDRNLAGPLDGERVSVILGSSTLSRVGTMDARIQRPLWLNALREQGIEESQAQQICDRIADQYVPWQEDSFPGLLSNVVAGRIANRLDLHGTSCTVDAACASSLAAVSAAVNELALGTADLVVTGGVDATNNPLMYVCFSKTPALSPTGDARPFSADADGTLLGEGLAMLALKRLDTAEHAGDKIYAVIRGLGTSSDGRGGAIYAPMPEGQVRALRRAYDAAGYGPDTVELVEAHGTATRAGDAAEFEALRHVFAETGRPDTGWCALGSVKSQIGHTKAAAGAAGLIKAVLALHRRVLPPTIKVRAPSPGLGIEDSPFYLNIAARPWTRDPEHPRRASVSSFGFGGANYHVTLEEHPRSEARATVGVVSATQAGDPGRIAFVFPGQGSQYVGMGADITMAFPQAREVWDRAAGFRLHDVVFPPPVFTDDQRAAQQRRLTDTRWAQPALAAHSLSLLALLHEAGIRPDCVAGHSLGELVALHAAGAMDAESLLRLAQHRGELLAGIDAEPGAMLAVSADADTVRAAIVEDTWIANLNAPRQTVVSGTVAAIEALHQRLSAGGVSAVRLNVSAAFHSPMARAVEAPLRAFLDKLDLTVPQIDVYGNTDAAIYGDDLRGTLARQVGAPVRFLNQIETMYADGVRTFIEVGAGSALTGLIGQILGDCPHLAVSLDRRGRDGVSTWQEALGRLAAHGVPMHHERTDEPAQPPAPARMTVRVNGSGYVPPTPARRPPAPNLVEAPALMTEPQPSAEWLAAVQEVQRQTAEAHMHFQRVLAESHQAFLQLAENTFATFAGQQPPPQPVPRQAPAPALLPPAPEPQPLPPPPVVRQPEPPPATTEPVSLALLLSVVADKTGYPVDMLDGGMDLAADLGIDSIKKVEIFAAVRERTHGLPPTDSPQMADLFQARTLDEVIRLATAADPATPSVVVRRLQVQPVPAPASGQEMAGVRQGPIAVVDDGSGLAAAVVARLTTHAITATVEHAPPPDAWGVILLGGDHHAAFRAARTVAAAMGQRGGVFVTVQDTGGTFGLSDPDPRRGGLAALARTAAQEWPSAAVKAIDCQRGDRPADAVAAALVDELLTGGPTLDVGLRADGTRWTLAERDAPAEEQLTITPESVLVVSGGARGITAAGLRALVTVAKPRLLLLGRTALAAEPGYLAGARDEPSVTRLLAEREPGRPAELAARARTILARREVRATLGDLERAGATVRYVALDITDRTALSRELDRVRREWGPITGIVHGAGVLADKRIVDKTDNDFDRVYATKVNGLEALLAATVDDPLDVLVLFSSVAARYGNAGQSDYAMANEVLNHIAGVEQRRRPSCRVRAIGWGPWDAGMVTTAHAAHFTSLGIPLIPLDQGAKAFVTELGTTDGTATVLITAGPHTEAVNATTHRFLADHAPAGTPVLPLAMAVEWLSTGSLADVRVLHRVDLPDLNGRFTIDGTDDLRLTSTAGRIHYSARRIPGAPAGRWATPDGLGDPITEPYASPALFHGPGFQVLRRVRLSPHGAEAEVVGARVMGWPGRWRTDPAAIDGALQAAVLWAAHTTGDATLPMGLDQVHVHRAGAAPGTLRCIVRAGSRTTDQARCDVALLDEDGRVRTELLGVRLVRRPDLAPA
ncbi:Phosphopantetheine attachment site [Asanoa hainanensis]|uniref:Phosphopantetheine attachment site n=1 Tax=Asanoa hainanensis TaxID=560556 RepID=A0A239N6I2_9ACTN|nr:type I polyketide synthase [Asanoa hainanensis]SNT50064.1 Phosphopantetheine attachment site [Asanoa hainanensis]